MKELILGGARSGKSGLAERRARESGLAVVYVATAEARDAEMADRIRRHRDRRSTDWRLIEEPIALGSSLRTHAGPDRCVIVDCLTLWLSNVLHARDDANLYTRERADFLDAVESVPGHLLLVSNETGMGIVPLGELSRRYCDEAGRLHQELARVCDRVTLVVAGLPVTLKGAA
ncbi:adenosylcobinamide kinase [Sulfurifustis variabilis]|uniref:Bifunctional adenosylcobalamin biosynthesis protein n=1 Tax=Sulfurifustis variabilis TaxID=1675686 RepID=A0A1B4V2E7_9GAMM|nr:bifunctional adenosylcobinamide kinase/adenosylcobinamide-phosphate guanylyltransferase [Sulfurifustis variabilis]BAU47718.1 adenosylcobinamide kinase [Sulfurifustis variabilis]